MLVLTGLAGCQSQPADDVSDTETDLPELAVPYTRGPSSPPSVKGPTSAPPGVTEAADVPQVETVTPQAVTETQDITITLPPGVPSTTTPTEAPGE